MLGNFLKGPLGFNSNKKLSSEEKAILRKVATELICKIDEGEEVSSGDILKIVEATIKGGK